MTMKGVAHGQKIMLKHLPCLCHPQCLELSPFLFNSHIILQVSPLRSILASVCLAVTWTALNYALGNKSLTSWSGFSHCPITELQNSWDWRGPLEMDLWRNCSPSSLLGRGSNRVGCLWECSGFKCLLLLSALMRWDLDYNINNVSGLVCAVWLTCVPGDAGHVRCVIAEQHCSAGEAMEYLSKWKKNSRQVPQKSHKPFTWEWKVLYWLSF